jgi:hypothetical protein
VAPSFTSFDVRTIPIVRPSRRAAAIALRAAFVAWGLLSTAFAAALPSGPPAGAARIWIYRLDEPNVSLARPYVRFNGKIVAISELGGAFYRDVAPGEYYVTVDSAGRDVNQFVRVDAAAGQQIYIEVQVLRDWDCGAPDADGDEWCRPTFYTRLQRPGVGAAAIAHSTLYNGD